MSFKLITGMVCSDFIARCLLMRFLIEKFQRPVLLVVTYYLSLSESENRKTYGS